MATLDELQAELAGISPAHIAQLVDDIAQHIREGVELPLRLLNAQQRSAIAMLAVYDPERFNDLQATLYALVPKSRRHELNLGTYFQDKIRDKKQERKQAERGLNAKAMPQGLPKPGEILERYNKRFVHTVSEPNDVVLDMQSQTKWRPRAWANMYNEPVQVGDEVMAAGDLWLRNIARNRAEAGIVCDPSREGGLFNATKTTQAFNTWKGLQVKPVAGDWSQIREMFREGLCGGSEVSFQFFIKDMARKLQFPHLHAETATVFLGAHGAGKGTLARIMTRIFGIRHCMPTPQKGALIGDFNEHLRDLCVLIADEAFFVGDKASFSILRSLITEPYLSIHVKFGARATVPSHLWVIVFSNDEHVIRTLGDRRRFHMPPMVEWHHNDDAYWTGLNRQIDNGGIEAMVHDLLAMDLSDHKHRYPPITENLIAQEAFTARHSLDAWLGDVLQRGYPYESRLGLFDALHVWPEHISRELAYKSYRQWMQSSSVSHYDSKNRNEVFKYLRDRVKGPGLREARLRDAIIDEIRGDGGISNVVVAPRARGFRLPQLVVMREDYDARLKLVTAWEPLDLNTNETSQSDISSTVTPENPDYEEEPDNE